MKFLKQFSAVLLLGLSLCVAADRGPVAPFQANEKIAFFGDSITHGGIYLYELQLFEALRHPYAPVRILNSGISGGSAWSGLQRIDFDLLERNPDRVFVMYGMNDVGRGNYLPGTPDEKTLAARSRSLDSYRRNLAAVVDRLTQAGKKVVLITPSPYDQYGTFKSSSFTPCNEPGLFDCAKIVREIAAERKLPVVEFHPVMTELLKKYPEKQLCGRDRIHPGRRGHLLMASLLLEALGETPEVGSILIDAKAKKAAGAKVENLAFGEEGGSFCYFPRALPWPVDGDYLAVDKIRPLTSRLNQEMLRVTGLTPGRYTLSADGRELGSFRGEELEKGVNLALLDTPSARRAKRAAQIAGQYRAVDQKLRNIVHGNILVQRQKGSIENPEEAVATLEKWLEASKSNPAWKYYCSVVRSYKENRPKEEALKAEAAKLYRELYRAARPDPYVIKISR